MMGAMGTQNMYSNFAVNKHLHTVASRWILLIQLLASYATVSLSPVDFLRGVTKMSNYVPIRKMLELQPVSLFKDFAI